MARYKLEDNTVVDTELATNSVSSDDLEASPDAASKIYVVQVRMTVIKDYTVRAKDEDEAVELLQEAGIVSTEAGIGSDEDYNEDYEVIGTSSKTEKPDVDTTEEPDVE